MERKEEREARYESLLTFLQKTKDGEYVEICRVPATSAERVERMRLENEIEGEYYYSVS